MASFLSTLFGGGAEKEAADKNRAALATYQTQGLGALDSGLASSKGYLDNAGSIYSGLQDKYGAGTKLYLDALGVNGLDAMTFAQNAQNQQWNGWLSNLGGLVSPEMSAASGTAGNMTNLSNLYQNDASNRIGLYGNVASGNIGANNLQAQGASQGARNLLGGALSLAGLGTNIFTGGGGSSLFK